MSDQPERKCVVCQRVTLPDDVPQTCGGCVQRVRQHLADVVLFVASLAVEVHASAWGSPGKPRNGPRSAERAGPGGDALVMLAGGSDGLTDSQAGDPPSVVHVLATWEDDWRSVLGHAAAGPASVSAAAGYLSTWLGTAAQRHPAFDEFASDVSKLRHRLAGQLHLLPKPERGERCDTEGCGERLHRPDRMWRPGGEKDDRGGLADDWHCDGCGVTLTPEQYGRLQLSRQPGTAADLERRLGVPAGTIRSWASRGQLAAVDRTAGGTPLYRPADVEALRVADREGAA